MSGNIQTAQALFINAFKKHRDRLFCKVDGLDYKYLDIDRASNRVANGIRKLGYRTNDRLAIILPNGIDYVVADFGILKSGTTLVPLNLAVSESDIAYILKEADVKMAIIDASFVDKLKAMISNLPELKHIVVVGGNTGGKYINWDDFKNEQSDGGIIPDSAPDDDAVIAFTGGTTGKPKGVVLSQRGVFFDMVAHSVDLPYQTNDKMLLMTPLSHGAGTLMLAGTVKGTSFLVEKSVDLFRALELIEKEKITTIFLVPTIIYVLLEVLKQKQYDMSSLRLIVYGAAPISETRLAEALQIFGPVLVQGYGQVECPNMITTLTVEDHIKALDHPSLLQSCGRPDIMVSLRIVDDSDNELPVGQIGEIIINTPYTMKCYLNQPELTAKTIVDGWLHTGDMGRVDEEGYVYIVDRKKDMIISGGMNVFPTEVEEVIRKHPQVNEVSVIGIPDDHWGEAVTACVVRKGDVSEDDIKNYCKDRLSKYAQPKTVIFKEQLPHTLIGKIDKRALREPYWEGKTRRVN